VTIRRRPFVVLEVQRSQLVVDPTKNPTNQAQHRVKLGCLAEGALGEELEVIWEIEPGDPGDESTGSLPTPEAFDDPHRLDAFLNAVRWGAISSTDDRVLQAPFRSGITLEDFQLDPVARALQMPRANLLIADDVGLGKTIEAGLVIEEMILRQRVRTVLIVCPSAIQIQWQEQMWEKFGLQFDIVNSAYVRELRKTRSLHANPWNQRVHLITSVDFIKREQPMRLFTELLPADGQPTYPRTFDLLVVDEAHNVAPSSGNNSDSQRTAAIRRIVPHFEHKLFLTATPHNGYQVSFTALLALLDNQRFAPGIEPDEKQLRAVMVRRLKTEIVNDKGELRFKGRKVEPIYVDYTDDEREAYRSLERYRKLLEQAVEGNSSRTATTFVLKLLKKRLFSCPAAFLTTLEKHEQTIRGIGRKDESFRPTTRALQQLYNEYDNEWADDELYEEGLGDAVGSATRLFDVISDKQKQLLRGLADWARNAQKRPDSKCLALFDWLNEHIRPNGGWSDERVILFTQYRTTQKWLHGLLAAEGFASDQRLLTIYGGMDADEREDIKAAFQASPEDSDVRILLATDSASEGINLQNHCHRVIHIEIPWNPNILEQRNGRVDRHGQKHHPLIFHFVGREVYEQDDLVNSRAGDLDADLEFLMVAARKTQQISKDLSGKVNPVIAAQVEERMLGRRVGMDTRMAESDASTIRRQLAFERDLRDEIGKLANQLSDSRKHLHIYPDSIKSVVDIGLEMAGKPPLEEATLKNVWPDKSGYRQSCPVFKVPQLDGAWRHCSHGLMHPHTGKIRPITFDDKIAEDRDDVVLVHLNHRLVQMCQQLLRRQIWAPPDSRKLNRVTARAVPQRLTSTPVVVAFGRIIVLGADNQSLHEEIIFAGGSLENGRFRRIDGVNKLGELIDSALDDSAADAIAQQFQNDWTRIRDPLLAALEARMATRTKNLASNLEKRATKEVADVEAVLTELESTIRSELKQSTEVQKKFWKEFTEEEFDRNTESLRYRVEQIPSELEKERARIMRHYSGPVPRLFPVAVMLLVPN
jgi:SNF2 family DNA or RNA helicase